MQINKFVKIISLHQTASFSCFMIGLTVVSFLTSSCGRAQRGEWVKPSSEMELVGIHAAMMPSGKVMLFGYKDGHHFVDEEGRYQLWDPQTQSPAGASEVIGGWNPFCAGHCFLGDGRLFIAGGFKFGDPGRSSSADKVGTVLVNSEGAIVWQRDYSKMEDKRWYPTVVTLGNGDGLIIGGSAPFAADNWKDTDEDYEYFSVDNNYLLRKNETQRDYPQDGDYAYPSGDGRQKVADGKKLAGLYPLVHLLPSDVARENKDAPKGILFVLTESFIRLYNPSTNQILQPKIDVGGFRTWWTQGSSVLLPIDITESGGVPSEVRVMLLGGGSLGTNDKNAPAITTAQIYRYDIAHRLIALEGSITMNRGRIMGDSVLLPDGNVVIAGGAEIGYANENSNRTTTAELIRFDGVGSLPSAIDLASATVARGYHASTVLLPDASIFVCGGTGGWNNAPVDEFKSVEVFSPPYLFLEERPEISDSPTVINLGESFTVETSASDVLPSIVLIRNGSRTHSLDTDQRMLRFEAKKTTLSNGSIRLEAKMPNNPTYIPPGPYMVFILKAAASKLFSPQSLVPSKAKFVHVTNQLKHEERMLQDIRISIRTGGDNLEHRNKAFAGVYDISDNQVAEFRLDQSDEEWVNFSEHQVTQSFFRPISINQLKKLEIRHTAENCDVCTPDNWNIDRLSVEVRDMEGRWIALLNNLTENPLVRLTGDYKKWQVRLDTSLSR